MNWVSNLSKARTDPKDDVVMNSPPRRGMHTVIHSCVIAELELDDTHYYHNSSIISS